MPGGGWNRGLKKPVMERLLAKTIPVTESGCLIWLGATYRGGYGHIGVDGRMHKVHRIVFENGVGPIPDGYVINHVCSVRLCVRPEHLEAVSQRENVLHSNSRSIAKLHSDLTHCKRGHPFSGDNIYWWRGSRRCRICRLNHSQARRR